MLKHAWVLGLLLFSSLAEARWYQPEHAEAGRPLYEKHCATCHGAQAEGAKNWTERQSDGRFPPPPLNGSAHTWHHPLPNLVGTIQYGQGNMPAWQETLSIPESLAIIAWLQHYWPDDIYEAWYRMNARAMQQRN
jgi:mono/diheme cytochrome c family protein